MKILAILLVISGIVKLFQIRNIISVNNTQDLGVLIDPDQLETICKGLITLDGVLEVICGLFIIFFI